MHLPFLLLLIFHVYYASEHRYSFHFKIICPPGKVSAELHLLNKIDDESYEDLDILSIGFDRSSEFVNMSAVIDLNEDGSNLKMGINHNCNGYRRYLMHHFQLPAFDAVYSGHVNLYTDKAVFKKEVQELEQEDSMEEEEGIAIKPAKTSSELGEEDEEETDPNVSSFFTPKKVDPDSAHTVSLISSFLILLISLVY